MKLLRIPRLIELLDVDRVKYIIGDYYARKMDEAIQAYDDTYSVPILKQIYYIQIYKVLRLVFIIFSSSYFLGILWFIFVCDL